MWILRCDERVGHPDRKALLPHKRGCAGIEIVEPDAAHPNLTSVACPNVRRVCGDQLVQACGPIVHRGH